jgi:hypothetical protein
MTTIFSNTTRFLLILLALFESACASTPVVIVPRSSHYSVTGENVPTSGQWLVIVRENGVIKAKTVSLNFKTEYASSKTGGQVPMHVLSKDSIALLRGSLVNHFFNAKSSLVSEGKLGEDPLFIVSNTPTIKTGEIPTSFVIDKGNEGKMKSAQFNVGQKSRSGKY